MSRPSSPEPPPQDLWSSILDSVSSSRSIPSKNILILGQPSSGKSLIASALLRNNLSDEGKDEDKTDFAFGYGFSNVRDDADEDTLARLSVYTVPSSSPSYTSLLPYFLPPRTSLLNTLILIVLDWTRPWTFVEELQTWLTWVEAWSKGDGSRELQLIREESRERLQSHLQLYSEPSVDTLPATNHMLSNSVLPLGPGVLTHNSAGIPIIVACTKADLIDDGNDMAAGASGMGGMVKGKGGEWEERTDGVMQILRTICLKYGASLFYTTPAPTSLQTLRQYTLHSLFLSPVPTQGMSSMDTQAPVRNPFLFQNKANTLDRDQIVIPTGWDSWRKISILRDGFDANSWGEAWERDLDGEAGDSGSREMFAMLVPDQGIKPTPLPPFNNPVPEQTFLTKNYDENAKKSDRDPRGAFRNPTDLAGAVTGVVGPLGSSSFNLPSVERALVEMEIGGGGGNATSTTDGVARRPAGRAAPGRLSELTPTGVTGQSTILTGRTPGSTLPPIGTPSPNNVIVGQAQHEVLHNFFQSLLSSRDRSGGSPAPSLTQGATLPRSDGHVNGVDEGSS